MTDREDREDWRRRRSLLASEGLASAKFQSRRSGTASLLSVAGQAKPSWQEDALARRRAIEQSRRETPARDAASRQERPDYDSEGAKGPAQPHGQDSERPASAFMRRLPHWARLKRSLPLDLNENTAPSQTNPVRFSEREDDPRSDHTRHAEREDDANGQQWTPLIDPMKVLGGIGRSKMLILAMALLGAGLGVAIALSTPKEYQAITELIVDPRDLQLTDRSLTESVLASDATLAIVENQVRVLTSGTVLNQVVDKLDLDDDPEFNGARGGGFSLRVFLRTLLSRDNGLPVDEAARRRALAINNLARSLSVERSGKTFVITIGATTEDGEKSALIANTMTDVFLQTYGQIQSHTAGRATEELTSRLDELRKGVETAERKVADFRAAHDLVDAQGRLISEDELTKLNEQLSVARARTLELNAKAASARAIDINSVLGGALPEEINSNTMADLRAQYAKIKQEADQAAVRLGPKHPQRKVLDAQLAGARERIAGELRRIVSSQQVELKRAVQLEQSLSSRLAQQKVRSGNVNDDMVTLRELERESAAKRSVYEAFLLRAKQTGEQRDINTANVNVISKAFAPLDPEGPSRALIALAGLLLGFASGVGLGAMRGAYESLRDTAALRARREKSKARPTLAARSHEPDSFGDAAGPPAYPTSSYPGHRHVPRQTFPEPVRDRAGYRPASHQRQYDEAETGQPLASMAYATQAQTASVPGEPPVSIEEIRDSLRDFHGAVRELMESRSRRRYF